MTQIAVGQWLDAWIVEEPLGEGAFAQVFRGKHSSHQHAAALKVPTDSRYVDRLRIDPRALQLEHAHVVRAQELHLDHDPPFLVLDLVEGGNLREAMHLEHLSWERISRIVGQLAAALDHAHDRGVLHLDLKPENVLIDTRGDVRLTDFGVVPPGSQEVLAQSLLLSAELGIVGTRDYAAPEMRAQGGTLDRRADVYGLGVVAFELLTGRLPIGLDRPSQLRPDLPTTVDDVLAAALARDPARRPSSAGAFAASLRDALKIGETTPERAPQTHSLQWLGAAVGVLLLAVVAAVFLRSAPEPHQGFALRQLWSTVPTNEPVILLPVSGVGPNSRAAARAVRAVLDRSLLRDGHAVYHPMTGDTEFQLSDLEDPARCAELVRAAETRWAVLAATVPGDDDAVKGAFYALVDLERQTLVAARPPRDAQAARLGERVAERFAKLPPGRVALDPSREADLGVQNYALARFDVELTCAVVSNLPTDFAVVADLGRFSGKPFTAEPQFTYVVDVELDADNSTATATTSAVRGGSPVYVPQEVKWTPPSDYDPTAGAAQLTRDPARRAELDQLIDQALAEALAQAHAASQAGDAARAVETLRDYRARGAGYASRVPSLAALADARRAAGDLDGCLRDYREALILDPARVDLRERYASVCLEEAQALFGGGKGRWYENDDEDKFARALELLELANGLELAAELRAQIDALAERIRREL